MVSQSTLLIICESSPESHRAAGERIRHLALASSSFFEKTVVLTLGNKGRTEDQNASSQILLQTVNFRRAFPFPLSAILDPIRLLVFIVHGLIAWRHFKPSFVVSSMPPLETGLSAWILARLLRLKLVIDLRDDWESAASSNLQQYFPKRIFDFLSMIACEIYSFSIGIFAATQTIAESIQERGIDTSVLVVPNGADSSLFVPMNSTVREKTRAKYALPLEKTVILYCGSGINPYNRLDVLLDSLEALPKEMVSKVFVAFYLLGGLDPLEKEKHALALSDDLVEIRGALPRSLLAEVMAACDIGLVPFADKPYLLCARSTKLYEYLSAGLYVISSGPEGGELDRFFSSNPHLGLFTSPSIHGFSDAFQCVLTSDANLFGNRMRDFRHSFIIQDYDRQKIMRKALGTLFTSVLGEKTVER